MNNKYLPFNNPVIHGLFADPDIIKYEDTYYLYPTTDGNNWSDTSFHAFWSKNLHEWHDCGVIFDVKSCNTKWSSGMAWAPAIIERNGYFYLYYCANQKIGVARSTSPTDVFENLSVEEPLLDYPHVNSHIDICQIIDPFIFTEHGHYYLLFGNGISPAIIELNDDMCSVNWDTLHQFTFCGDSEFCEAICVFKYQDIYYFSWSCNDTRSEDYHVNYGISSSLFGPIKVKGTLLQKDASKNRLAPGHHTILQDEEIFYIAYHRFCTDTSMNFQGDERGYNREVCMNRLTVIPEHQELIIKFE